MVGSSGIVLNYEAGKDIDAHDMVFRFNSAPTKGGRTPQLVLLIVG